MNWLKFICAVFYGCVLGACSIESSQRYFDSKTDALSESYIFDSIEKREDSVQTYLVDFNVTYQQGVGIGSSFGREMDTVYYSNSLDFICSKLIVFSDSINSYVFYKNNSFFPRRINRNDKIIWFFERSSSFPECEGYSMISVFGFEDGVFKDSFSVCPLDIGLDLSRRQTDEELIDLLKDRSIRD